MKYIRTKDGIYVAYIDKNTTLEEVNLAYTGDKAIDIADTIEELCDEFVCVRRRDNKHYNTEDKKIFDYWYLDKDFVTCDWYGAIWTDKGLIYVAKLNEEGDFELL